MQATPRAVRARRPRASARALARLPARREAAAVAPPPTPAPTPPPAIAFEEKAAAMGIDFTHVNGARGKKWMPETMGGGVAVLDYDGDGRPDLLFVSGAYWPGDPRAATDRSPRSRSTATRAPDADGLPHFRERHARGGAREGLLRHGRLGRATTTTTAATTSTSRRSAATSCSTTSAAASRRSRRRRASPTRAGARPSAWLDYDGDGPARPLRLPLRRLEPGEGPLLHARRQDEVLLHARALRRRRRPTSTATSAGGRFEDVTKKAGRRQREPEGPRRRALGLRRRRPGRPPRGQRHRAEQPLPQQGRRDVRGRRASRRASPSTRRAGRAARWAPRGPTRRTAGASRWRSATSRTS